MTLVKEFVGMSWKKLVTERLDKEAPDANGKEELSATYRLSNHSHRKW